MKQKLLAFVNRAELVLKVVAKVISALLVLLGGFKGLLT
jgi:hypothetical protein